MNDTIFEETLAWLEKHQRHLRLLRKDFIEPNTGCKSDGPRMRMEAAEVAHSSENGREQYGQERFCGWLFRSRESHFAGEGLKIEIESVAPRLFLFEITMRGESESLQRFIFDCRLNGIVA
jgi:hypothetical protein